MVNSQRYNGVARTLHWLIAVLIIANLLTGILHEPLHAGALLIPTHMAIGIVVLLLSVLRLLWHFTWRRPAYPGHMPPAQRMAASVVRFALYFGMIAMPLAGWIFVSPGSHPISMFGLFDWPRLPFSRGDAIVGSAHEFHEVFGWVMAVVVVVHIAAAMYHHFVVRDDVLRRMM